jgi:hypothetical protein
MTHNLSLCAATINRVTQHFIALLKALSLLINLSLLPGLSNVSGKFSKVILSVSVSLTEFGLRALELLDNSTKATLKCSEKSVVFNGTIFNINT